MYLEIIKNLRIDNDIKQVDIAHLLGISQNYYSRIENGSRTLTIEMLILLCKFYGVSSDYILGLK